MGYAALQLRGTPDWTESHLDDTLQTIINEAHRCGRIVKGLLQFARQEQTRKWLMPLNEVVRHGLDLLAATAPRRSIPVDCRLTPGSARR